MRLHVWSCLVLLQLSACLALSKSVGRFKDSDEVSTTKALIDPRADESTALSSRRLQNFTALANSTNDQSDSAQEARSITSTLHDFAYKAADTLNVSPTTMYHLLLVKDASGSVERSMRLKMWFKYIAKVRSKKGAYAYPAEKAYNLLHKSRSDDQLAGLFLELQLRHETYELGTNMLVYMLSRPGDKQAIFAKLLNYKQTPNQVFPLLCDANVKIEPFVEWLKYTGMYRHFEARVPEFNVVEQQKFFFPIMDMLKGQKSVDELVELFTSASSSLDSNVAKIAGELKTIAEQEISIANALKKATPPSPESYANSLDLVVANNDELVHWLRYCQLYSSAAKDVDGKAISLESVHQMVLDVVLKTTLREELVPVFQSVREAPGMQRFVDGMIDASYRLQQNHQWLMDGRSPHEVYDKLTAVSPVNYVQWFRFISLFEAKTESTVSLNEIRQILVPPGVPYSTAHEAAFFEEYKNIVDIRPLVTRLQKDIYDIPVLRGIAIPETPRRLAESNMF